MRRALISVVCSGAVLSAAETPGGRTFERFAIAAVSPLATQAGVDAIKRGGNAVDAAIACALTLGVVDGHNSGIGGGCFIVIRAADGTAMAIDGREMAPAKAHRDMYVINGKLDDEASKTGALASGVPGALAAYDLALQKHGKLKLADLLRPAADLAEKGFPIDEVYERKLAATAAKLKKFAESAATLFNLDGTPLKKGDALVQRNLAATYRAIADNGISWFYRGPFAETTAAWMKENGGIMTADDFANYKTVEREPIRTRYRGYDLISMPPPSSGGVHVAQILNILEHFPIRHFRDSSRVHVMTEAMKLAFADRAHWLGDPDFANVPRGLVDPAYAADLAKKIDLDHATIVANHNNPTNWEGDIFGKHTTHLSAADADGNWVALTQTINTAFGSKVMIPGTGVLLNDEMDDFSVQPGVPNAFKLIGGEANAVAPGKRPLSSMSPTIVLKDGHPFLTVGAAGGPTIITQTLLAITNILDLGLSAEKALAAPRFHHQWRPESLKIETKFGDDTLTQLEKLGHKLDKTASMGATQCVSFDPKTKRFTPVHDPRVPGGADGL
jgi:gamma-glutamyltranspeptidase / glutathione hydrolase